MKINEIKNIEELEQYTQELTDMCIADNDNEYYATEAFGSDLCDFTDEQQDDLVNMAERFYDCIDTIRAWDGDDAYDIIDNINGLFWTLADAVRSEWEMNE